MISPPLDGVNAVYTIRISYEMAIIETKGRCGAVLKEHRCRFDFRKATEPDNWWSQSSDASRQIDVGNCRTGGSMVPQSRMRSYFLLLDPLSRVHFSSFFWYLHHFQPVVDILSMFRQQL